MWETVEMAQHAEAHAYESFWVTEHHTTGVGHASPEVLVAALGAATQRIRIGAGGVLLRYHSPYRIACAYRALEVLFPGRIDVGLARGVVTKDRKNALLEGTAERPFEKGIEKAVAFLRGVGRPPPSPATTPPPSVWMLGGPSAMQRAARHGTAFCLDHFTAREEYDTRAAIEEYRSTFRPNRWLKRPRWAVAVGGLCARTDREAERTVETYRASGGGTFPTIIGGPETCQRLLLEVAKEHRTSHIVFHDASPNLRTRKESTKLLADALELGTLRRK
jgi:luciferase family oxidoreductase group 1